MAHEVSHEFPEQRLTRELIRIRADLLDGDPGDRTLNELLEVLEKYGREIDGDCPAMSHHSRHSPGTQSFLNTHGLSILLAMLQETQTQLRNRTFDVATRIESSEVVRHAYVNYVGAAQREREPTPLPVFRYQL